MRQILSGLWSFIAAPAAGRAEVADVRGRLPGSPHDAAPHYPKSFRLSVGRALGADESPMSHTTDPEPLVGTEIDGRALVFGEALFDHFPDGTRVLGGAPFNVAWHLRGLGRDPLLVSAVGDDEEGREILSRMSDWGLSTRALGRAAELPTGRVEVEIQNGTPSYRIPPGQAWDRIPAPEFGEGAPGLVYHGTLALREAPSFARCFELRARFDGAPVFVDLNLREPWWSPHAVARSLDGAGWVKVSTEELAVLSGKPTDTAPRCEAAARSVLSIHAVGRILVTRSEQGALLIPRGGEALSVAAVPTDRVVDTVGAGDAFAAAVCRGILSGWTDRLSLERAAAFAAAVCGIRGATAADLGLYGPHVQP